jgi:hypothetical protein
LVGIEADPVNVIVEGDQVKVVATGTRRILYSVTLPAPVAGKPPKGTPMNLTPVDLKNDG